MLSIALILTCFVSCCLFDNFFGGDKPPTGDNESDNGSPFVGNDDLTELCVLSSGTAVISATSENGATTVKLSDSKTNSPLMVRVPVDSTWDTVKIVQGEKVKYSKVYTKKGVSLIDFSILPNTDDAVITPALTTDNKELESEFGMILSNGIKIDAIKALVISEEKIVNPSDVTVFITVNDEKVIIPANSVYYLDGHVKVTATFDADNGTEKSVSELDVASLIKRPTDPTKNGFTFIGWYVDGKAWNFNDRITESITLKAEYEALAFEGASAVVLPVKGGAGGIISLIHDDGRSGSGYILDELYHKYSLIGDVAMLTNNIYDATTETAKPEYDKWKSIIDTGRWSVISHSITHTWWGNVTKDDSGNNIAWEQDDGKMYDEIVKSLEILRNLFPEHRVLTFAYPGFSAEKAGLTSKQYLEIIYDEDSRALIDQHYISARNSVETGPAYVTEEANWLYLDAFFLNPTRIDGTGTGSLKNRLESAANDGRIHMISLHAVSNDVSKGEWDGYTLSSLDMENACKLISEYVSSGKVWNAHYEDAILYVREAQNATVSVSGDENGLAVTLTDTMDDAIYNYPLTVRVTVPGAWEAVKVTQGESVSYAIVKYADGKCFVDTDIVPDKGVATLTPILKKDIPYTPAEKPVPPASSVLPAPPATPPESLLDKEITVDFSTDPGVTASSGGTIAFVDRDGGKALHVVDALTNAMGGCIIPLGASTSVEAFSFTFDINVKQATSFAATMYFGDSSKTPYMLYIQSSGTGYFIGDCQSNSGGAGKTTPNLTGKAPLEFNKWYTVKIDVIFSSIDDFKAVWYVEGIKTGESTNRANYTKATDAALQNTVKCFAVSSLNGELLDMQLDNLVMKAGTVEKLGLDGSETLIGMNFEEGVSGITNNNANVALSTVAKSTSDNALKVVKTAEGGAHVIFKASTTISNAKELTFEFDINVESTNNTTLAQIFFNSTISKSPFDLALCSNSSGYYFQALNTYNGGSFTKFGSENKILSYGKYYHVKLHIVIGNADTFTATLYIEGEPVGTSNLFLNPNKESGYQPATEVNRIDFTYQNKATFVMYLDNVSLTAK